MEYHKIQQMARQPISPLTLPTLTLMVVRGCDPGSCVCEQCYDEATAYE